MASEHFGTPGFAWVRVQAWVIRPVLGLMSCTLRGVALAPNLTTCPVCPLPKCNGTLVRRWCLFLFRFLHFSYNKYIKLQLNLHLHLHTPPQPANLAGAVALTRFAFSSPNNTNHNHMAPAPYMSQRKRNQNFFNLQVTSTLNRYSCGLHRDRAHVHFQDN